MYNKLLRLGGLSLSRACGLKLWIGYHFWSKEGDVKQLVLELKMVNVLVALASWT